MLKKLVKQFLNGMEGDIMINDTYVDYIYPCMFTCIYKLYVTSNCFLDFSIEYPPLASLLSSRHFFYLKL